MENNSFNNKHVAVKRSSFSILSCKYFTKSVFFTFKSVVNFKVILYIFLFYHVKKLSFDSNKFNYTSKIKLINNILIPFKEEMLFNSVY